MINLLDVSGFIYRSFFAMPRLAHGDKEVAALYGFCAAMTRITAMFPNSMFIAALDSGRKTFRSEIYPEYKANRKSMPDELVAQIPLIKEACGRFGFLCIEKPGFEADDIIATCVRKIADRKVNIISSDKDLMQLLGGNISIYDPMKRKYVTPDDVMEKFGVSPEKVLDVLALMGDTSDNVPGIPGVGVKTAAELINKFGSLDGLVANIESLPKSHKNTRIKTEINKAILSRKLVQLRDDLDLELSYAVSKPKDLKSFLLRFDFKSLVKKNSIALLKE